MFHMLYKEDWEETKRIFEKWWDGVLGRPLIQVVYPKDEGLPWIDSCAFLHYYPNVEEALEKLFQQFSRIVFGKEAYPNVWMNLGPMDLKDVKERYGSRICILGNVDCKQHRS